MPLQFGEFTFDRAARQLLRGGKAVHLEPKAFELLDLLLERRPEAVSKPEIRDRLWPDTFVSESSLTTLVAQVREALGDDRGKAKHIRTVHGFGYAFTARGRDSQGDRRSIARSPGHLGKADHPARARREHSRARRGSGGPDRRAGSLPTPRAHRP